MYIKLKTKNRQAANISVKDSRRQAQKLFWQRCLSVFVFLCFLSVSTCVFAVGAKDNSVPAVVGSDAAGIVRQICSQIYEGDFAAARGLLAERNESKSTAINQLADIVSEYEAIQQSRQSARQVVYQEQLDKLDKFRATADINDLVDINDINDSNNITSVLSVIARAGGIANQQQKAELLADRFVNRVFQKVIDKAAEFESKGKWLDSYIICYRWLEQIDEGNKAYEDYAEQLIDKANIAASFEDSPCETRRQRYSGIKKEMFVRAVDVLSSNYVSILDYRQMATKAIERCHLLADIMRTSFEDMSQKDIELSSDEDFEPPDSKALANWSSGLTAILDQVNKSFMGIGKDKFINIFEQVLVLNATTIKLPRSVLIAHFAEAALASLDPYTVIVWPKQSEDFEKIITNEFTGIGIEISKLKGQLTVASLLPDTPAYNSGLDAGDVIEAVDGVKTKDMSLICAVKRITGPAGTDVKLTVKNPSEEKTRDIIITRARIIVPTIRGWQRTAPAACQNNVKSSEVSSDIQAGKWLYMIDQANKIGYVRITSFSEKTASDFEKVLTYLEIQGLKGLILDLRFNSGGLLPSAADVTDKFIEEGLIVRTQPRIGPVNHLPAHRKNTHPNYPLVILINNLSASASEIVAGALADPKYQRAILVGQRTHGKGSVQGISFYPGQGAQLKYTIAYYHLPSGQRVESRDAMEKQGRNDWGVKPDIEVKLRSDELEEQLKIQRDNDVLVKVNHDTKGESIKKHKAEETLATDPQLAIGLLVIKSKLIESSI